MKPKHYKVALLLAALIPSFNATAEELVFSSVQGKCSQSQRMLIDSELEIHSRSENAVKHFRILLEPENGKNVLLVEFCPRRSYLGRITADVVLRGKDTPLRKKIQFFGLSAQGIEGKNEPGLREVLSTIGYKVDVGWRGLHKHTKAELLGEEIKIKGFKKAGAGKVSLNPIARYSPDFKLPFGYYLLDKKLKRETVATLAKATKDRPEHNTLMPSIADGNTEFDPGKASFGVFTKSPSHVAYTSDKLNRRYFPNKVSHAVRVYPAKNRLGDLIPNAFLLCFEEAKNGDYQDYVFLLSNVKAVH